VRFEDLNGPKGSPADRCAIKVVISGQQSVMVEVVDATPRAAFDNCIDSVERAVRRTLERATTKARKR
jgi:ribosome-associated translation inhibitor RaiA